MSPLRDGFIPPLTRSAGPLWVTDKPSSQVDDRCHGDVMSTHHTLDHQRQTKSMTAGDFLLADPIFKTPAALVETNNGNEPTYDDQSSEADADAFSRVKTLLAAELRRCEPFYPRRRDEARIGDRS